MLLVDELGNGGGLGMELCIPTKGELPGALGGLEGEDVASPLGEACPVDGVAGSFSMSTSISMVGLEFLFGLQRELLKAKAPGLLVSTTVPSHSIGSGFQSPQV